MSAELASVLALCVREAKAGGGQFSDAHGQLLATLARADLQLLQQGSELLARRVVTKVVTPSGRSFFRVSSLSRFRRQSELVPTDASQPFDVSMVSGGGPNYYNCFAHYCSCAAFHETAVRVHPTAMCKHMVARLLADATGQFETMHVDDAHFAQMLCPPRTDRNDF